ncbi:MAG: TonB family protein [Bacteroidetes bacterium]|nr:TonB family protein [Bacteroidota bacterium]
MMSKKYSWLFILMMLHTCLKLQAQVFEEKFFYDISMNKCDSTQAYYQEILTYYDTTYGQSIGKIKLLKKYGGLIWDGDYSSIADRRKQGVTTTFYENGNVKSLANYNSDLLDGELLSYYANNQLRRKDFYERGRLLFGNCYTQEGKDTAHYDYNIMPQYPGGNNELLKFIAEQIEYPEEALDKGITGVVYTKFTIDLNGKVKNIHLKQPVHKLLDSAALKIIGKIKSKWLPGYLDGEPIEMEVELPISFTL